MKTMTIQNSATKESVRQFMQSQAHANRQHDNAIPSIEEIRRQLGWKLLQNNGTYQQMT